MNWKPPSKPRVTIGRPAYVDGSGIFCWRSPIDAGVQPRIYRAGITWSAIVCVRVSAIRSTAFVWNSSATAGFPSCLREAPGRRKIALSMAGRRLPGLDHVAARRWRTQRLPITKQALFDRLRAVLIPGKGKSQPKPGSNELAEMWRAVASLERLESKHKQALGQVLLKSVRRSPAPTYAFWSLTRLGARRLLYGPLNTIVHPDLVAAWIDALLPFEPGHPAEVTAWGFCLAQLARRTGQRALDVDEALSQRVAARLRQFTLPPGWIRMVEEIVERQAEEQSQVFGESLPIGLRLTAGTD